MPKLTKSLVESALPKARQYSIWCSELPGFGVFIQPTGRRTYFVDYRTADGIRRRMTIGRHGKITTEEARKLAISTLGNAVRGGDPAEERATRRKSLTVAELCDRYFDAAEKGLIIGRAGRAKKPSTIETDRGRIERHIKPLLGRKLVIDVRQSDISRFIRDVTAGKTATDEKTGRKRGRAIVEGGAGTAARTTGLLGGIMSFAVSEGIIETNPVRGVKRPADNRRQRRLTAEEYRALGDALAAAAAAAETEQGIFGAWLLALTACRLGEVAALKWNEVDEAGGCFRLQDTKEGRSVRPIGRPAFDVLAKIPRRDGCPYVLPAVRSNDHFGGLPGAWERIAKRAGLEGITPHTLRHSFASVSGDLGFAESTIAAMLGHADGSVTSRYIHHLDAVMLAAADRVSRTILCFMTGVEGKVVRMSRRVKANP